MIKSAMIKLLRGVSPLALCSLFAVGAQAAEVTPEDSVAHFITPETQLMIRQTAGGMSQASIMWIGAGRYRLQSIHDGKEGVEIFRNDSLYLMNFDKRKYSLLTRERLLAAAERTRQFRPERPPVQRELRETQRRTIVGKYLCQFWEVYEDGVMTKDMCVMPLLTLPTRRPLTETIERYNALFKDTDTNDASLPWSDAMTMKALPIQVRNFVDGKLHSETVVLDVNTDVPRLTTRYDLPPDMTEITENTK